MVIVTIIATTKIAFLNFSLLIKSASWIHVIAIEIVSNINPMVEKFVKNISITPRINKSVDNVLKIFLLMFYLLRYGYYKS